MASRDEAVVKAFDPIGKYRVRLLESAKGERFLDVREYVEAESFEGFTRRGIRLTLEQSEELRHVLSQVSEVHARA